MEFEDNLKSFEKDAKKLIESGNIKDIIFSDNLYEIEVFDQETYWPFLQINDEKKILDVFCDCKTYEKQGFCQHLSAAFFKITQREEPIHVRFKKSFFNALFKIACFEIGFDKALEKKQEGVFFFLNENKKEIFSIEAKNKAITILKEHLKEKPLEEKSLKYSTISFDEMTLLKKGQASDQLKYELSFFSDLAKLFFLKQEAGEEYKIEFKDKEDFLYSQIIVSFEDIKAKFYIPFASWNEVIPTLNTVKSKLSLYEYEGKEIKSIKYDRGKKCFYLKKTKGFFEDESKKHVGKRVGYYIYVEDIGFYSISPNEILQADIIDREKISYFLSKYTKIFSEKLENEKINPKLVKCKYFLYFDEDGNFNINAYLFEKDDFEKPFSCFFGPWVYIQDRGFYHIEGLYFPTEKKIINREDVSNFVTKHRTWLYNFEGFQTHFGSFQSHLIYSLTAKKELVFSSKLEFPEELGTFIDFNDWIYVKGLGFFSKKEKIMQLPIRPGLILKKSEISKFIETHKDELGQVDNFYTDIIPIEKVGLNIYLDEDTNIVVQPEIKLKEGFDLKNLYFFEKYAYLENEGFFEIPKAFNLPQRYEKKQIISKDQEEFFITFELDRLKSHIILLDKRLQKPQKLQLKLINIIKRKRKNKIFWLLDLVYHSEIGRVHASDLFNAINKNEKFIFSDAGLIFFKKARFNWLKNLTKKKIPKKTSFLELTSIDIVRLFLIEDVQITKSQTKEAIQTRKLLEELKTFETDKLFDISMLKSSLRPYQEIGIKWLWFLYVNNLSGLLCDEMGLGKTHQSMALLAAIHKENTYKYLVVCPTSVIYHWEDLLKRFLPSIKVYVYHGYQRKFEEFKDHDLLLTSYGIVRAEKELFKKNKFEVAIFDEIQIAKNSASLIHKALRSVDATMRIGLTGTPIENYLSELKAIFDLILPAYLGTDSFFKEYFLQPIEKDNDVERQRLLKKMINPFILRRKKKDVLLDLPDKIEEIAYADLSDEQKKLYNDLITRSHETIIKNLQDETKPVSYIHVFSLLAKLKQACDHPSLILKDIDYYHRHVSGKFDLFLELLHEAKESSQKIVVFSQYLNMIKIIENYLKKQLIGYALITGATKKRFQEIKRFKEDPNCCVFLASLLAAGVGIDLSCASVVIHYDRWWNPAKEDQATDRVHRIGQNRGVQVFKLVMKNTIEEKIHSIIEGKKELIEEMIGKDEVDQIKTLTRQELLDILHKIEER